MTRLVMNLQNLGLSADCSEALLKFEELFLKWNQRINLSAARSLDDIDHHVRDSLHVVPHLRGSPRVVDVGSGGGFPVLIAAVCLPSVAFVALEPVHKKHAFLRTAARELQLVNVEAHAVRMDDHPVRNYDVAMSRATFDLREWLIAGKSLIRSDGLVIGFEATPRDDLPEPFERHPYDLEGKQRSIITVRHHS